MDNTMFAFMDIIVVGCGVYILYAYYLLMAKNEIKEGVLLAKGVSPKKCKDFEAYKKFMAPKVLIFGIAACISGGIGLYQDYIAPLNKYVYAAFFIIFMALLVWFMLMVRKAEKRFW